MKTTNYYETFILASEDSPAKGSEMPTLRNGEMTTAGIQYDLIKNNPYKYTSDDIIFAVYAQKNNIEKDDMEAEKENFFSKGQACLRTSPLVKRYGWGIHSNNEGKVALYPLESKEYKKFSNEKSLKQVKGMRSKRK